MPRSTQSAANDRIALVIGVVHRILRRRISRAKTAALVAYIAASMPRAKRSRLAKRCDRKAIKETIAMALRITQATSRPA